MPAPRTATQPWAKPAGASHPSIATTTRPLHSRRLNPGREARAGRTGVGRVAAGIIKPDARVFRLHMGI